DLHRTREPKSFLEDTGKDKCSAVCHQRYKYRTEDKGYDLGSFYIVRNFRQAVHTPPGASKGFSITTGEVKKVPATLQAPSKEKSAKETAPGLVKGGVLTGGPAAP